MKKNLLRSALGALLCILCSAISFAGEQITYFHSDMLGSPVAATDEKGYVKWRATYEPYGERIQSTTDAVVSSDQSVWYGSHVHDVETGLMYMEARYQDPQIGRFFSIDPAAIDPAVPASYNRYAFGFNNPYRFIDPDGRQSEEFSWLNFFVVDAFRSQVEGIDFEGGMHQFPGANRYLYDDAGYQASRRFAADGFRGAARDTAHIGDLWLTASMWGLGAADEYAAARGMQLALKGGAQKQLTVIGHLPDYVKVAEARGANYLKPSADWNWFKQGDFIREVIARGDNVLIGTSIRAGDSVLRHEIKQLVKAGYRPIEQGSPFLIKVGP